LIINSPTDADECRRSVDVQQ